MRKAAGPSGVTGEMIKAAGEQAVDWLTSICNRIVKEEAIPESWQMSELVPIYKGKGDVLECGSSQGIKLLEPITLVLNACAIKLVDKIVTYLLVM